MAARGRTKRVSRVRGRWARREAGRLTVLAADAVLDEHDGRVTGGDGRGDVILERRLAAQQGLRAACTERPRETSVGSHPAVDESESRLTDDEIKLGHGLVRLSRRAVGWGQTQGGA